MEKNIHDHILFENNSNNYLNKFKIVLILCNQNFSYIILRLQNNFVFAY